jgi:hypothetical protein
MDGHANARSPKSMQALALPRASGETTGRLQGES